MTYDDWKTTPPDDDPYGEESRDDDRDDRSDHDEPDPEPDPEPDRTYGWGVSP